MQEHCNETLKLETTKRTNVTKTDMNNTSKVSEHLPVVNYTAKNASRP